MEEQVVVDDGEVEDEFESKKDKKKRLEQEAEAELQAKDDSREHLNIVFIGHVGKSYCSSLT
jgi:hypothetical protein